MRGELHPMLLELLGEADTLRLLELFGGTQLYIPVGPNVGTLQVAQQVSPEAEIALAQEFGGNNLKIPLARSWRARIYRRRGLSHREIARRLGCTEKAVADWVKTRLPSTQLNLF
jgi:hypothetical protein